MPMRTLPLRLIRSQVDSVLDCARAGMMLAAVSAAAATPAAAISRRRMVIGTPCSNGLLGHWRQAPLLRGSSLGAAPARRKMCANRSPRRLFQDLHRIVPQALLVDRDAEARRARHDHAAVLDRERLGEKVALEEVLRLIELAAERDVERGGDQVGAREMGDAGLE